MKDPHKDLILTRLSYNKENGEFRWIDDFARKAKKGRLAGGVSSHGYWRIQLPCGRCYGHRLAWIICNGDIPEGCEIDHVNGDKKDNRIKNLRLATRGQNTMNVGLKSNNTSGIKDVVWDKTRNKWRVQITAMGVNYHGGRFSSITSAETARNRLIQKLHGKFENTTGECDD